MNMMMKGAAVLAALACAVPAEAGMRAQMRRQQRMVMGPEAEQREEQLLTKITWNTSLDQALAKAKAEDKPVFWMHMLGQIDGST